LVEEEQVWFLSYSSADLSTTEKPAAGVGEQGALDYRSILVPVDFSDYSERTASYATKLASRYEAKLNLLHVFQTPAYASTPYQGTHNKNCAGRFPNNPLGVTIFAQFFRTSCSLVS
jgi:hypothetical protein